MNPAATLALASLFALPFLVQDRGRRQRPPQRPAPQTPARPAPTPVAPSPPAPGSGRTAAAPASQDPAPQPARLRIDLSRPGVAKEFFEACDYDGNGWISFGEARTGLGAERAEFAVYDRDRDGRVTPEEFERRFREVVERTGTFRRPPAPGAGRPAIQRSPEQLRNAYDRDLDGRLDLAELTSALADYDREELSAERVLEKLDRDGSKRIELGELAALSRMLATSFEEFEEAPGEAATIEELFGGLIPRGEGLLAAPQPPQIPGPVSHFRRLDLDHDGAIRPEDLRRLQSPLQLPARASAVLAVLDTNGDGGVDEAEFLLALGDIPR